MCALLKVKGLEPAGKEAGPDLGVQVRAVPDGPEVANSTPVKK